MSATESDDDFGNFSDASFEPVEDVSESQEVLNDKIDRVFGEKTVDSVQHNVPATHTSVLEDLLREERPNVVYHALVDSDKRDIPPFLWNRSNLRSTMLKVLRLDQPSSGQLGTPPLVGDAAGGPSATPPPGIADDQLYQKVAALAQDTDIAVGPGTQLLRDHFGIQYLPPLVQPSLAATVQRESLEGIPELLKRADDDDTLHDELCNVIDLVVLELRRLEETRLQLEADKKTFERVITNLSGHTQRLQRDEIAHYNKKKSRHNRWHRFSWAGGNPA